MFILLILFVIIIYIAYLISQKTEHYLEMPPVITQLPPVTPEITNNNSQFDLLAEKYLRLCSNLNNSMETHELCHCMAEIYMNCPRHSNVVNSKECQDAINNMVYHNKCNITML